MKLLTFLTRRQAWLAPNEISREFRLDGRRVAARTIHRWFRFLREKGSFVYYPYPKASVLGLQDVLVRVRGLRNPHALGILPFGASFNVEVAMGEVQPFISQGYWVPATAMEEFQDYWRAVRDLGLAESVELFRSRNTHFVFSPLDQLTNPNGWAEFREPVDNRYFEALLKRNLRERFEVRLGEAIARSPLVVPLVVEHIWAHYSSRHVWQAIRAKGEESLRAYATGRLARNLRTPGSALRLLQTQWATLMGHFDAVFLQPRVLFDWTVLRNAAFVSLVLNPGSVDRMVEAAVRASERCVYAQLKPGVGFEEGCHLQCFLPSDQLLPAIRTVREFHVGREPPLVALQDRAATIDLFRSAFCKVDWRLFDPSQLSWRFDGGAYLEKLKELKPTAS